MTIHNRMDDARQLMALALHGKTVESSQVQEDLSITDIKTRMNNYVVCLMMIADATFTIGDFRYRPLNMKTKLGSGMEVSCDIRDITGLTEVITMPAAVLMWDGFDTLVKDVIRSKDTFAYLLDTGNDPMTPEHIMSWPQKYKVRVDMLTRWYCLANDVSLFNMPQAMYDPRTKQFIISDKLAFSEDIDNVPIYIDRVDFLDASRFANIIRGLRAKYDDVVKVREQTIEKSRILEYSKYLTERGYMVLRNPNAK